MVTTEAKKTFRMYGIERQFGKPIQLVIKDLLAKHSDKPLHERKLAAASELGVSKATFYNWLWLYPDGNNQ